MTKQQQIDTLQKQLDAANEQIATIDNALKEQYVNTATNIVNEIKDWFVDRFYNPGYINQMTSITTLTTLTQRLKPLLLSIRRAYFVNCLWHSAKHADSLLSNA